MNEAQREHEMPRVVRIDSARSMQPGGKKAIRLTEEEREILLKELAEVTAELDELQSRTVELAARVLGPICVEQPRSA
ncbi:hypothetical protein GCM10010411_47260 [Actinomadura fulvescens]|uniref:Transposase n=1 Tax=Actinomadura fulvescens TaxID=46160 RepID=A0ABN3Q063_9ACTN